MKLTLMTHDATGLSGLTSPERGMTLTFRTMSSRPPLPSRSNVIPGYASLAVEPAYVGPRTLPTWPRVSEVLREASTVDSYESVWLDLGMSGSEMSARAW